MPRQSYEEYEIDDNDYEDRYRVRKLRREKEETDKKKKWDRESVYDRDNDYDDRR